MTTHLGLGSSKGRYEELNEPPKYDAHDSVIGTGILGLVTVAMYDDPLTIYREYIQNSADAFGSMGVDGKKKIEISLQQSERKVRIRDNGPGLSFNDALRQLVPIGRSDKCIGIDRGFRGIGRLAALAFADRVTFTTRSRRDEPVTRVTWDGGRMSSRANVGTPVDQLVMDSVDVGQFLEPEAPDHFFEVEVTGVARHAAGKLLNRNAVRRYISEVCPVPMSSVFPYSEIINDIFPSDSSPVSLEIELNGDTEPIERPHGGCIPFPADREDGFTEFETFHIPSVDLNGDAAAGWIAHSSYLGAIPKHARIRGIRARIGNIQIGDETVFDRLYSEERFNRWCVGELHVLDSRILTNGRRDYFEPGPHLRNLENHLRPIMQKISARCRAASTARNRDRKSKMLISEIEDVYDLAASGYLGTDRAAMLVRQALDLIPSLREQMIASHLEHSDVERLNIVESKLNAFDGEIAICPFGDIEPNRVGTYRQMFDALATVTSSPRMARELIVAVMESAPDFANNHIGHN